MTRRPSRILDPGAPPRLHAEGFPALVRDTAAAACRATDQRTAIETLLTFDARVPLPLRRQSLTIESLAALEAVQTRPQGPVAAHSVAAIAPDGRVRVGSPRPLTAAPSAVEAVGVPVPVEFGTDDLRRYAIAKRGLDRQTAIDRREALAWVAHAGTTALAQAVAELEKASSHADPLWLYVDDRVYSNFYVHNLAGRVLLPSSEDALRARLDPERPSDWDVHDATLLYCTSLLLAAGGMSQIEAFNGTQMLPHRVGAYLVERLRSYGDTSRPVAESYPERLAAASELASQRKRVAKTNVLYRRINGIVMNKSERRLSHSEVREATEQLAAAGVWSDTEATYDPTAFEATIERVIRTTVALTGAEVGMSRGLRCPLELIRAVRAEAWSEIVNWDIYRYYCCVVPSDDLALAGRERPGELADLLWAIAARMQYNSWHFIPGNLPWCPPVEQRDHFNPPVLPDIADWSDQHHRGHVVNTVRFAVRAPVAVRIAGRSFAGFTDVRLTRSEGPPFDPAALAVAIAASRVVGAAAQAFCDHADRTGEDLRVESFTPEWYAATASTPAQATANAPA